MLAALNLKTPAFALGEDSIERASIPGEVNDFLLGVSDFLGVRGFQGVRVLNLAEELVAGAGEPVADAAIDVDLPVVLPTVELPLAVILLGLTETVFRLPGGGGEDSRRGASIHLLSPDATKKCENNEKDRQLQFP